MLTTKRSPKSVDVYTVARVHLMMVPPLSGKGRIVVWQDLTQADQMIARRNLTIDKGTRSIDQSCLTSIIDAFK